MKIELGQLYKTQVGSLGLVTVKVLWKEPEGFPGFGFYRIFPQEKATPGECFYAKAEHLLPV